MQYEYVAPDKSKIVHTKSCILSKESNKPSYQLQHMVVFWIEAVYGGSMGQMIRNWPRIMPLWCELGISESIIGLIKAFGLINRSSQTSLKVIDLF